MQNFLYLLALQKSMGKGLERLLAVLLGASSLLGVNCTRQIRKADLSRAPDQPKQPQQQSSAVREMRYLREFPEYTLATHIEVYANLVNIDNDIEMEAASGYGIGAYRDNTSQDVYRVGIFDFPKQIQLQGHIKYLSEKSGVKPEMRDIKGKAVYCLNGIETDYGIANVSYVLIGNKILRVISAPGSRFPQQLIEAYLDKK